MLDDFAPGLVETEVAFASGDDRIAGTLVQAGGGQRSPACILVHGSGPADRDSGGTFVALRNHLAAHGIAALAYDKPGVRGSTGDWRGQSFFDRAAELVAAMRFLRTQPGIDGRQIGLCGGSQAGWVMPLAARQAREVAFVISISGAAVTPHAQEAYRIERQLRVDGFPEEQVQRALALLARRLEMIRLGTPIAQVFAMQDEAHAEPWYPYLGGETEEDVAFFAAICDFDPAPFLERLRCPFLGIWGELDTFVPVAESLANTRAALTKARNPDVTLKVFPRASHRLRVAETGGLHEPAGDFAPGFLETITTWLTTRLHLPGASDA